MTKHEAAREIIAQKGGCNHPMVDCEDCPLCAEHDRESVCYNLKGPTYRAWAEAAQVWLDANPEEAQA